MGSVLHLDVPFRQTTPAARKSAMIQRFAQERRVDNDVFWLKENAELLNLLDCTNAKLDDFALAPLEAFYGDFEKRLGFFPQYYRFLLSLCLDLEDLGLPGGKGEEAVAWVAKQGLVTAELSDLQRAEARRLCLRRGIDPVNGDGALDTRLRRFASQKETFALPNKKAAYELTHIVFYLSEYGRAMPDLAPGTVASLLHAGTLAFLELNTDLLSEFCIALRFAGETPPFEWEDWLFSQARRFVVEAGELGWAQDDYHPYLMVNWALSVAGQGGFGAQIPEGPICFRAPRPHVSPLRELSEGLLAQDGVRCADWYRMRDRLGETLSDEALAVVDVAEKAVDFEAFFAGFARAAQPGQDFGGLR
ncbi:DUF6902 family protein [Roseovarius aestuariivivens]|uniref:DUF6902 family protein n=1 Tax=Roseovarius aestuariivivens TaxID=1888910 RepID=UPI0010821D31|nr:hypothetical protein [Roseovarius aestuariivivens]